MAQVDTIIQQGCSSGIGKEEDLIKLLQITAQNLNTGNLQASVILQNACASGIGKIEDQKKLLVIIAQLLYEG